VKILLSIKPEYVNKILSGEKKFEFRRFSRLKSPVKVVVIYATQPVGKVVGEFEVDDFIQESPEKLWELTYQFAGVEKHFFDDYFKGKSIGAAFKIGNVCTYDEPLSLEELGNNIRAPQSFRYL
jgi:predicted transcriptional regulator